MATYRNRNLGYGQNVLDAEHQIADSYLVVAKDVNVGAGFVQTRNGFELWNEDGTMSGGITMMTPAYFRDGTRFLVFANADHYYSLPNDADTTDSWTDLGDYGTEVLNPYAIMHKNNVIFGTGKVGNTPKKWDGTGTIDDITTPADTTNDLRFYQYFQGTNIAYLLGAGNQRDNATDNNSTLYYAPDSDNWAGGGYLPIGDGDGQHLTGLAGHSNILAFKENSKYRCDVVIEPSTSVSVMRVLERFEDGGAINHESIVVALNDIIALSGRKGDGVRGFAQVQTALGGSESKRYSTKVAPLFDKINKSVAKNTIRAIVYDEKLLIAAPLGGSTSNNVLFVGHLNQPTDIGEPAWTLYSMNVGSFAVLLDENNEEVLLLGDSQSPKIYKWNENILSDNKTQISPRIVTKRLDMGDVGIDTFENIILAGEMASPTEIQVKVMIDGKSTTYTITNDQVYTGGSLVWSHIIGNEIVGGNSSGDGFQKLRWLAVLPIPDQLRDGNEIQLEIKSSGVGYWWKLDNLIIQGMEDDSINLNMFADNHWVNAM